MQSAIINRVAAQQERLSLFRPGLFKIYQYRGRGGGVALIHLLTKETLSIFCRQISESIFNRQIQSPTQTSDICFAKS